jgi:GNAT superfamily N-acetyltransferase
MTAPDGPEIRVRRGDERDLPALARLRRTWAEQRGRLSPGADPLFEQDFAAWWRTEQPRRAFWLAEVGDPRVGTTAIGSLNVVEIAAMPAPGLRPDRWGYVGNVVVLDGFSGRGVPRRLLTAAIVHAEQEGYSRLALRPTAAGAAFYRAAGFAPAGDDMVVLHTGRPAQDGRGAQPQGSPAE